METTNKENLTTLTDENETGLQESPDTNNAIMALAAATSDLARAINTINYSPTNWVDNAPPDINAANLNKIEQGILQATNMINNTVGAINTLNGNILKYKSYEFTDSSFGAATITNMAEHYWTNISNRSYGLIQYSNNSSVWIGTYMKYSDSDGVITINGLGNTYPFQKGVLENGVWYWSSIITNSDLTDRFYPIRVSVGETIKTFSKALEGKSNSVSFIAFGEDIPDNPFSFEHGYAIAFNSGLLRTSKVFTLIGIDFKALKEIEIKVLDIS